MESSDFVTAVADIYIVRQAGVPRNGLRIPLVDMSGARNTVIQSSGNFFDETIGFRAEVPAEFPLVRMPWSMMSARMDTTIQVLILSAILPLK